MYWNINKTYWEGSCAVKGSFGGKNVAGKVYMELAGYVRP